MEERTDGTLRLRRGDRRLGVRWQRRRAPRRGEGLPGRRHGVRQALEGRGHPEDAMGPAALPVAARGGAVRDPADRVPRRRARSSAAPASAAGRTSTPTRLYVPPKQFFDAPEWAGITDWADELAPCLDQATRMLGVVRYPYMPTDVDRYMQQVAIEMGRGETFNKAPVGVYFGQPGRRGRRPVLRRGRAAAHRLHLVRQLQHRLRPQRQEQADDELPVPGGEARRSRSTSCTRCTTSSRSRAAGSRCTPAIPAGRSERRTFTIIPTPPSR